ncbi:MAG: nucleoside recognition domain-containing protein, partial [Desulfonatronovibrionaceae bacterium]
MPRIDKRITRPAVRLVKDSAQASLELFKVMVPIIVVVRILQDLGLISYLAVPLEPVMRLMGLPGSMGLVWATGLINNIYAAMIVFVSLPESGQMTTAQVTVLSTLMLIAHALPVELKIAQKSGPRLLFQGLTRMGSALVVCMALNLIYTKANILQEPCSIIWDPDPIPAGYVSWALTQLKNLAAIFGIITLLLVVMRT